MSISCKSDHYGFSEKLCLLKLLELNLEICFYFYGECQMDSVVYLIHEENKRPPKWTMNVEFNILEVREKNNKSRHTAYLIYKILFIAS